MHFGVLRLSRRVHNDGVCRRRGRPHVTLTARGLALLARVSCVCSLRKEELDSMAGHEAFNSFYTRLRDIREYHAKFVRDADAPKTTVLAAIKVDVTFSGEEAMGRWVVLAAVSESGLLCVTVHVHGLCRYLDLHEFHDRFLNLYSGDRCVRRSRHTPQQSWCIADRGACHAQCCRVVMLDGARLDYRSYLEQLCSFGLLERTPRTSAVCVVARCVVPAVLRRLIGAPSVAVVLQGYRQYLADVVRYLFSFQRRAQPLVVRVLRPDPL